MGRVFLRVSLLVVLWSTGAISSSVFYSGPQANMVLRAKRANSFLEELKPPSKERECVEEICDFEEAREIFQTREATMEFWTVYRDGNQCEPNPCLNGVCVDEFQAYSCKCIPGFEGKLCNFNSTASNCSKDNGDCDHGCHESKDGLSRTCSCLSGYSLQENSRNCLSSVNFACGQVILTKPITVLRPFVVGGQIGKKGESPWQALILNKKGRLHCGGVLIAESWVLTSAHCLEEGSPYSVRLGDYERFKMEDTEVTLPVTQFISHPEYNTNTEDNDIAMLRLASPVQYTQYIVPVCLPSRDLAEHVLLKNGTETIVTGWGKEKETSKHLSSALNFIKVPLVEHAECASAMVNNVTQNMLCAGRLGHQEDACKGDSGGPMVTKFRKTWFLIGLVSWGEGCGRMDKFGIYTKVSNYLEWIQSVQSTSRPT